MQNLKHTLYQTSSKDGEDIIAHIVNMCSIRAELHQMGLKLKDEEFNNILVSSLPATWDTTMMPYLGNAMPSQQLVTTICDEYNKRKAAKQQACDV